MTREEEIIKASYRYAKHQQKPFIDGARYADKTMIDKVCKWLKENIDHYAYNKDFVSLNEFIQTFKKKMEE